MGKINYPTILMMHSIAGRVRLKISHPIVDMKEADSFLKQADGIYDIDYNEIIKSLTIKYNPSIITLENVIFKVSLFISNTYGYTKIKFISNVEKSEMPLISYYSLISIIGSGIVQLINPGGQALSLVNWIATGTTVGAIFEHGYNEMKEKGSIDPEVMSIMYLINSIGKENMMNASLISWITTFGRHLLKKSHESFLIKVSKVKLPCSDQCYYDFSVVPEEINNKRLETFKMFANEMIQSKQINNNKLSNFKSVNLNREIFCNFK